MTVSGSTCSAIGAKGTIIHKLRHTFNHELPKTPSTSSSAGFIEGNDDLLMHILVYLPIKSLFRLQCVSKRWFSIIVDPFFRRLHYKATTASTAGHGTHLLYRWEKKLELDFVTDEEGFVNIMEETVSDMDKMFHAGTIQGIHSCNGLVAVSLSYKDAHNYVDLFVYNPATRQCKKIPQYFLKYTYSPNRNFIALYIAFDPLKSHHYKLVCVSCVDSGQMKFMIYNSEFQGWSCHDCPNHYEDEDLMWYAGIFWNGDIHWASEWGLYECLDVDGEGLRDMPEHPLYKDEANIDIFFFGQCGRDLCIMGVKKRYTLLFDVYKMELDYSRWTLKYCLDLSVLPRLVYPYPWKFNVLSCIVKNEKDQPVLMISLPGKLISWDTNGMIVKEIADVVPHRKDKCSMFRWDECFKYVETFASV